VRGAHGVILHPRAHIGGRRCLKLEEEEEEEEVVAGAKEDILRKHLFDV
jgi:hypothetical protein